MRTTLPTAIVVAVLLAVLATTASALNSIHITPAGADRAASREFTFMLPEELEHRIICEFFVRLEATERIPKTEGALAANVTEAAVSERCLAGVMRILRPEASRPWRLTYVSFRGTLPLITLIALELRGFATLVQVEAPFPYSCLYSGNLRFSAPAEGRARFNEIDTLFEGAASLARQLSGVVRCPATLTAAGHVVLERAWTATLM